MCLGWPVPFPAGFGTTFMTNLDTDLPLPRSMRGLSFSPSRGDGPDWVMVEDTLLVALMRNGETEKDRALLDRRLPRRPRHVTPAGAASAPA
jgi:hypothetical protein